MKCPNCNIGIHKDFKHHWINGDDSDIERKFYGYQLSYMICPECKKPIIYLAEGEAKYQLGLGVDDRWFLADNDKETLIQPKFTNVMVDKLVPKKYVDEFMEATKTIQASPKASATLSRRLLQWVLNEELKIKKNDLDSEIKEYEKMQGVNSEFIGLLQLLRTVGNFGAHPKKIKNTSEIVSVEKGEAELLLDIIEILFDEVFIKKKMMRQKTDAIKERYQILD